jgi:hypothetical protein
MLIILSICNIRPWMTKLVNLRIVFNDLTLKWRKRIVDKFQSHNDHRQLDYRKVDQNQLDQTTGGLNNKRTKRQLEQIPTRPKDNLTKRQLDQTTTRLNDN